jgi:hypothetical protein
VTGVEGRLLETKDARIDVGGVPQIEGLSLGTSTEHVLLLGAARALFEVASGIREVARGSASVRGVTPREGLLAGEIATAALDPPLPPSWTSREYATWSARLAGHGRSVARALASEALARMKVSGPDAPLGRVSPTVRCAAVLAGALATGARTIFFEDPSHLMADEVARPFTQSVAEALADRAWIAFAPRARAGSPLAERAEEAIVVMGSTVVEQGPPSSLATGPRAYVLRVLGEADEFSRRIEARGVLVRRAGASMIVDLGELLSMPQLFAIAEESKSIVLELRPASRAFE